MDSIRVQIKHSSVLTEKCSFGSSSSGESSVAKQSHSICVGRGGNSDEITAMDVATSKEARIGATNLSEPKRVSEKPELANMSALGDEGGSLDDSCIDDIFFKESVRKKLQFLSYMVGMDCSNPVEVLSEVVRVLKELNGGWCFKSQAKVN